MSYVGVGFNPHTVARILLYRIEVGTIGLYAGGASLTGIEPAPAVPFVLMGQSLATVVVIHLGMKDLGDELQTIGHFHLERGIDAGALALGLAVKGRVALVGPRGITKAAVVGDIDRSEEHTSELQSRGHLVCRLLLEKKTAHQPPSRS